MIRALPAMLALVALPMAACTGSAPTRPDPVVANADFGQVKPTQSGRYRVGLALEPDPPPLGELFSVRATITLPDGTPLQNAVVTLDARMPQHDHGMETRPRVRPGVCGDTDAPAAGASAAGDDDTDAAEAAPCLHPGGIYRADGFKFHMGGAWTVLVTVDGPKGPDSTSFVYEMP